MKRIIIVHGWEGKAMEGWRTWLKKELEKRDFKVILPQMPNTKYPRAKEWVSHLAKAIGKPDENTFILGHSLGGKTILNYLQTLETGQRIGAAIFLGAVVSRTKYKELQSFFRKPINWRSIKSHCKRFVSINSDNDKYIPLSEGRLLKQKLGARLVIKHNMHHFSAHGFKKLPFLLEEIKQISK